MAQQGAGPAGAAQARGLDIGQGLDPQHLGAGGAGEAGNDADADGDGHRNGAEADGGDDGQGQQQAWQGQQHIDDAHDHGIDPAADEARDDAQAQAADQRQAHRQQRGLHRQARAIQHPGIQVAAQFVGAEPVQRAGRQQLGRGLGGIGIDLGEQAGCQRRHQGEQHQQQRDHEPRAAQQRPGLVAQALQAPARAPLGGFAGHGNQTLQDGHLRSPWAYG